MYLLEDLLQLFLDFFFFFLTPSHSNETKNTLQFQPNHALDLIGLIQSEAETVFSPHPQQRGGSSASCNDSLEGGEQQRQSLRVAGLNCFLTRGIFVQLLLLL